MAPVTRRALAAARCGLSLAKTQPHRHEAPHLVRHVLIFGRSAEAAMGHALEHVQFRGHAMPAKRSVKAHRVRQEQVARARL